MDALSRFSMPGILFLLTLASGLWLSNSGKPLNTVIFTIHKLIALAAVILVIMYIANTIKGVEVQVITISLLVIAGLCVLALFTTGALISMGKLNYELSLTIHRIAPLVAAAAMALVVWRTL
jgi:hypothetical protein